MVCNLHAWDLDQNQNEAPFRKGPARPLTVVVGLAPARGGADGARGEAGVGAGQAHGGHGAGEQGGRGQLQQGDVVGVQNPVPQRVFKNLGRRGGGWAELRGRTWGGLTWGGAEVWRRRGLRAKRAVVEEGAQMELHRQNLRKLAFDTSVILSFCIFVLFYNEQSFTLPSEAAFRICKGAFSLGKKALD